MSQEEKEQKALALLIQAKTMMDQGMVFLDEAQEIIKEIKPSYSVIAQTHVRFDSPVGTKAERDAIMLKNGKAGWPGAWFDATPYGTRYNATGKWAVHPGADLNLPNQGDLNAPCFSVAEGVVVFAGPLPVWGLVVVVRHTMADGTPVYSRYAHLNALFVADKQGVSRGEALGLIGNAGGRYAPHLHFDMVKGAVLDLGEKPDDWPGDDLPRVQRCYYNPLDFIYVNHHD